MYIKTYIAFKTKIVNELYVLLNANSNLIGHSRLYILLYWCGLSEGGIFCFF